MVNLRRAHERRIDRHVGLEVTEAGLIERGREAQTRPARLNPAALKIAADWIEEYRRFWEQSFDRLDAYLRRVQADNKTTKRKGREK